MRIPLEITLNGNTEAEVKISKEKFRLKMGFELTVD
jgi:hypothetical protein